MDFLIAALGLGILLVAGDALVKGAVNLSLRLGVPALIVSLTIVAFGTSAPELLVSVEAVLDGVPGLALGNVIGSNTANILLVLGLPALITPLHTSGCDTRKNYIYMIGASLLFTVLAFFGTIGRVSGLIMLAALAAILTVAFRDARAHRRETKAQARARADNGADEVEVEGADPSLPLWKIAAYLLVGLAGLPMGADLLVEGSVGVATRFGVSDSVIGLTLVAIGTSAPELATTVVAALRRQADVALGNAIGSNIFNLLAIVGLTSLVRPIPVAPEFLTFDIWVMLAASAVLVVFVFFNRDIGRLWGVLLTGLYGLYMLSLLMI